MLKYIYKKKKSLYNHTCLLRRKTPFTWKALWLLITFWVQPCKKITEIKAEGCQVALHSNDRWTGILREVCEEQKKKGPGRWRRSGFSAMWALSGTLKSFAKMVTLTNALCGCILCSWWHSGRDWVSVMRWQAEKQKEEADITRRT